MGSDRTVPDGERCPECGGASKCYPDCHRPCDDEIERLQAALEQIRRLPSLDERLHNTIAAAAHYIADSALSAKEETP